VKFAIGTQADGAFILRFEQTSVRVDLALTRPDLEALNLEVQMALSKEPRR
jgi:hypothetical protein